MQNVWEKKYNLFQTLFYQSEYVADLNVFLNKYCT